MMGCYTVHLLPSKNGNFQRGSEQPQDSGPDLAPTLVLFLPTIDFLNPPNLLIVLKKQGEFQTS